ncbi:DUF1802 family protein [Methylacidiphilum caldifontis]|uniref:DUF1802 domain-containing protein n=1 Tax=Methylacidiphilum caldifontis TaxID=2795386 RepID=A0A4Y8PDJ9_9BACT|nr:DUF1802 family protein [Methylacidiphilum caldifontis]TFE68932.1 hypothetical protein A7Q10_07520 [Methylacidiphilum caldifontis]
MSESFVGSKTADFLNSPLDYAFKEWRIVVEALAKGVQSILLRKGGIQEKEFQLKSPFFWLLPTHYHEELLQIKPEYRYLEKHEEEPPQGLELKYVAQVHEDFFIPDWELIRKLSDYHIWEEQLLKNRFDYGKKKGLSLLIVRVYRAFPPLKLDEQKIKLGGCRSWIKLPYSVADIQLEAVINDEKFCEMRKNILHIIN